MQIYTKILIGMAVGVVLGITLGPKSDLLTHDLYRVKRAEVRLDRDDAKTAVSLGAAEVGLRQLEVVTEQRPDATGALQTVPAWARVRFQVTERMLLSGEALRQALGNPRAGQEVTAWLAIKNVPLEGGGFQSMPTPVSALGHTVTSWIKPVGDVFMRLLKMVIAPLVFASLLVGVAGLGDVRKLGRLGGRTLGIYLVTTAIAVGIGLLVANLIQPGSFIDAADRARLLAEYGGDVGAKAAAAATAPSALDNVLEIIPTNPLGALASGNMLQIIFFAVILGVALTLLGKGEGQIVVTFFDKIQNAMVMVIHIVMAIAPYGVAALVADVVGNSGLSILKALLAYGLVVLLGLALHTLLVYGVLVRVLARLPLRRFFAAIRPAQLVAFSTSSSSATLPVSMECAEQNLGASNAVASFVLPLGSTVNMDGTALYQGVAAVFIAQVFQMDLGATEQLGIVLTATMASIGAAGVPGAGMVTLAMVLTTAGIPELGLALILGMDRLLDMFRTTVNVTGDLAVTAVMAVGEGERLSPLSSDDDQAHPDRGFERRLERAPEAIDPD
ncbi:MAG: dicarboxylate/amino acid:cation symporter [Myxococcales bacterium]|nr:dicarboxylate/amino acid:cation symporter [Myxococcales bacterium]